jgi:hypothetical protein
MMTLLLTWLAAVPAAQAEPTAPIAEWYAFFDALEGWQGGVAVRCLVDDADALEAGQAPSTTAWSKYEAGEWAALVHAAQGATYLVDASGRATAELTWSADEQGGCAASIRDLPRKEARAIPVATPPERPSGHRWELQLDALRHDRGATADARQLAGWMLHEAKAARALEMSATLASAEP